MSLCATLMPSEVTAGRVHRLDGAQGGGDDGGRRLRFAAREFDKSRREGQ
ncbi:hypothetical protein [Pseudonocardia nigra]|nr:hypothetical protein [Pseudonocardia nigra]